MSCIVVFGHNEKGLPLFVVCPPIALLEALHHDLPRMCQLRRNKYFRFARLEWRLQPSRRVGDTLLKRCTSTSASTLPFKRERTIVHLVLKRKWDTSGLGWVRSDNSAEDPSTIIQGGCILFVIEQRGWQSALSAEPGEVFAVPIVTSLVVVVRIIIP